MKRTIITAILLPWAAAVSGQVKVENAKIDRDGASATVSFEAKIDAKATKRNYKLILTPVVYNAEGAASLAPIVVETRRTRIRDLRDGVAPVPGARTTGNGATVDYTATMPWVDWMMKTDLRFEMLSAGCCSEEDLGQRVVANDIAANLPIDPNAANVNVGGMLLVMTRNAEPRSIVPAGGEPEPMQTLVDSLNIGFAQGSARINLNSFNNYTALGEVISILQSKQDVVLQGRIEITGTASPEGSEALNYELAQKRALAVRNYILDNVYWLRPANFNIVNGGQNWEGLYKLVEESRMPGGWEVLDIIENTPPGIDVVNNVSRKKFLMELHQGRTWKYMEAHFFPQLRGAASITVYTPVPKGSKASTVPPAENTAIINRAIDRAAARDAAGALALLMPVSNDARAWNPMGVAFVVEGDLARAKEYFGKAAAAGYTEAQSNLEQLPVTETSPQPTR
jgi:outer membrane protein OmpA-like peptidoglycan-associated protein